MDQLVRPPEPGGVSQDYVADMENSGDQEYSRASGSRCAFIDCCKGQFQVGKPPAHRVCSHQPHELEPDRHKLLQLSNFSLTIDKQMQSVPWGC